MGSHNPPFLGAQRPRWHIVSVTDSDTICNNNPSLPLADIVFFGLPLKVLKHLLWRGFCILIRNISFPSPINVGSHNLPSLGANVLIGTPSGDWLHRLWDFPQGFKIRLLWRVFAYPYEECFVSLFNQCKISQFYSDKK